MSTTAMWANGSAFVIESPQNLTSISRFGFGTDVLLNGGDTECWVHISIPTPVILRTRRPQLVRVSYLWTTSSTATLQDIHLCDGATRIFELSELGQSGQHHAGIDDQNTFGT